MTGIERVESERRNAMRKIASEWMTRNSAELHSRHDWDLLVKWNNPVLDLIAEFGVYLAISKQGTHFPSAQSSET